MIPPLPIMISDYIKYYLLYTVSFFLEDYNIIYKVIQQSTDCCSNNFESYIFRPYQI
jgi:hypothetical protein